MTVLLGVVAVVLFLVVLTAIVVSTRERDTLAFTMPEDLAAATRAAQNATGPLIDEAGTAHPRARIEMTLDEFVAEQTTAADRSSMPSDFYPGNLGVGTTLRYGGSSSEIFGVLSFDHAGILWQDYLAEDVGGRWWRFGVEPARGMKLAAFEPRMIALIPGPAHLMFEDEVFELTESGQANYRSAGRTGRNPTGTYAYYDYENSTGKILSFEQFDGAQWITSIGHHVDAAKVHVCNAIDA